MNIIYLDTLFLVNFLCDYILLLCTARVCGAVIVRGRILFSAALGGIYACLCTLPPLDWLGLPLMKAACSIAMCLIAFGKERRLLPCTVLFICISAMAGGVFSALSLSFGSVLYLPFCGKAVLPVFFLMYALLSILFRRGLPMSKREYQQITVTLGQRQVSFRSLRDTGNELSDPLCNRPVVICQPQALQPLFTQPIDTQQDPYELYLRLSRSEGCAHRMRMIPCRTITGTGLLVGFKPDHVTIDHVEEDCIVAFAPCTFSADAAYQAIY